jgi:hypothetical protein
MSKQYLSVVGKTSDLCSIRFPNGSEHDGYVPNGIGIGGGDYLRLEIDIETGQISNWPGAKAIIEAQFSNKDEDEDTDW